MMHQPKNAADNPEALKTISRSKLLRIMLANRYLSGLISIQTHNKGESHSFMISSSWRGVNDGYFLG